MIGHIRKLSTPFYDKSAGKMDFKTRPALIIAQADSSDYVVLPISSVSIRSNLDPLFDIPIDPAVYPLSNLHHVSYARTHKQTVVHLGEIGGIICDLRTAYPDLYEEILSARRTFSAEIDKQNK